MTHNSVWKACFTISCSWRLILAMQHISYYADVLKMAIWYLMREKICDTSLLSTSQMPKYICDSPLQHQPHVSEDKHGLSPLTFLGSPCAKSHFRQPGVLLDPNLNLLFHHFTLGVLLIILAHDFHDNRPYHNKICCFRSLILCFHKVYIFEGLLIWGTCGPQCAPVF